MSQTEVHRLVFAPNTQQLSLARIRWDLSRRDNERYEAHFKTRDAVPSELFQGADRTWLEVGAGTGAFFCELARKHPDVTCVAVERCRTRGSRLIRKSQRSGLSNFAGVRGNVVPTLIHGVPSERLERVYILYPCPWPKNAHRKNRWYLHPVMPHLVRVLKPGGRLIWASDQKFYLDECRLVCESLYGLKTLVHGPVAPNSYNDLEAFPEGRTKFERTFLANQLPCYELIVEKPLPQ